MARNPNRQTTFYFKRFSIDNKLSAMKVGTDGVLLGAWASVAEGAAALDVGSGTGLIALMLAQRGAGNVIGVEIDPIASAEAKGNVERSPWPGNVSVLCADFSQLSPSDFAAPVAPVAPVAPTGLAASTDTAAPTAPTSLSSPPPPLPRSSGLFDLIASNPPYFIGGALAPDALRRAARHELGSLSAAIVIRNGAKLLSESGRLALVLPADHETDVLFEATLSGLSPTRLCHVSTVEGKSPSRLLLEFAHSSLHIPLEKEHLFIRTKDGFYSEKYINLTKDFYLNF